MKSYISYTANYITPNCKLQEKVLENIVTKILKKKVEFLKITGPHGPNTLVIDVAIRWNRSYDMLESYHFLEKAVLGALRTNTEMICVAWLGSIDSSSMDMALTILKQLKTCTTILCDSNKQTISLILPFMAKILRIMETTTADTTFT